MEKTNKLTAKKLIVIILSVFLVLGAALGLLLFLQNQVKQVASEQEYRYLNPDETKAEPDAGITIDGVLDEKEYLDNNWLYLRNDNGNATVDIATTSYYGEKGMYFVYDVTESTPIYVNLNRNSAMNSCIELYLALSDVTNMDRSEIFEIDLLPTGDMVFKQRNGKGAFMDVATTDDMMAYLGTTTKGGEINTEDCYGYCLEFFIPWDYLDFLGLDVKTLKTDYVFVNTAHITSYNYAGTAETDRYWYSFAQQLGGNGWGNVSLYYRFDKDGVIGTVPVSLEQGKNCTITGAPTVIPGMKTHVEIIPQEGYALNSILVNGEEYIKKVSYNEDGSVSLDVRGVKEGLKISASAEPITDGNKTINGTVKVHKVGGDSLNDVTASYMGPNGEKPITLDSKGNFTLTDLKQGYYTITVEKKGYEKVVRGIYLNRDVDTEITLEYQMFEVESGRCWQLEEVNDGIINKMGGFGSLVTTDEYKKFSVEANFKYYQDVADSLEEQDRLEQRQGIRIKFSNDKYWHIDLLYQNDKYFIQYAKATTNSIFNFRDIYVLSEEEIAKFKSEDGIQLKVERDGSRAIIYLGGNLIAVEDLDKEYENLTAKVGFESWGPYTDVRSMEYKISSNVNVKVDELLFGYHKAWDVTKQFEGVVSQPKGGNTVWLRFFEKLTNIDLNIKVLDNPKVDGEAPRTTIRFEFDNGETFFVSICESNRGVLQLQNLKSTTNKKDYASYYNFTAEEQAQYKTEEGIDFRFVRNGTEIVFFIDGEYKTSVDLSEHIKADTKAIVSIQHQGDQGVPYVMPFRMTETIDTVKITTEANDGKKIMTDKNAYVVGQKVTVEAEEGYYINQITVNGKDESKNLNLHGTYDFIATEKEYTIKANVVESVFGYSAKWNLLNQNQGTNDKGATVGWVSLPNGGEGGGGGWLYFDDKYKDMDLTWRVQDHPGSDEENTEAPRTTFEFLFDNEENLILSVCESNKGVIQIQNLKSSINEKDYSSYYNFSDDEKAQYQTEEGIDVRFVRNGTDILFFVDGEYKTCYDLSNFIQADTKATVRVRHNDDKGVEIKMPFAVTDKPEKVTLTAEANDGKKLVTDMANYVVGQKVKVEAEEGYYINNITVNGKDDSANLKLHGAYEFIATETEYAIKATVAKKVFGYAAVWNLLNQNQGTNDKDATVGYISLPNGGEGGGGGWLYFNDEYKDMDLTWRVQDHPGSDEENTEAPRTTFEFLFDNEQNLILSVCESNKGVIQIQNLNSSINEKDYSSYYNFSADEKAQYQTEEGIDVRFVRSGTILYIFVGDDYRTSINLSEFIEKDTKMTVRVRHNDDKGVEIKIPFAVNDTLEPVNIIKEENDKGTLKVVFAYNGTVVLEEDTLENSKYYLSAIKVDDTDIPLDIDGKVQFETAETSHTVDGVYKKAIFENHVDWILTNQNQGTTDGVTSGTVSIKNGGYAGVLYLYRTTDKDGNKGFDYGDIDYTLTLRDYAEGAGAPSTQIRFVFEVTDGQKVLDLYVDESNDVVRIRNAQHSTMQIGDKTLYEFTESEKASYKDAGIDVRVVREGKKISLYVGGEFKRSIDLTGHIQNESMSRIAIFHDGDSGVQVDIPYKLSVPTKELMGGQYLSILGDSVSMCAGMPENSNNNSSTAINHAQDIYGNPRNFGIANNWELTYWGQSIVTNNIQLLVNNSVSGGLLHDYPHSSVMTGANGKKQENFVPGYVRAEQLHDNTDSGIQNGTEPDIIYLYMGTEDYKQKNNVSGFQTAYKNTLDTLTREYENAEIFCFTVLPYCPKSQGDLSTNMTNRWKAHNDSIREIASQYENVTLVDLAKYINETNYKSYYPNVNWGDLVTPNADGHNVIAEVLQSALSSQYLIKSNVTVQSSEFGTITVDKTNCEFGDTITITAPKAADVATGYYLDGLKVNGEVQAFDSDGTYKYVADRVSIVIEGVYKKKIFTDDADWNLTEQNQGTDKGVTSGVVTLPNGGNGGWLYLYRTETDYDYGDIDLTLTLKDYNDAKATVASMQIGFVFKVDNAEKVYTLCVTEKSGKVQITNINHTSYNVGENTYYEFSDAEYNKYKGEGIQVRVLREGTKISLYVGQQFKKSIYLAAPIANETMGKVRLQHDGDAGVQVDIPYSLSFPQKKSMSGKYVSILGDGISMSTGVPTNEDGTSTADNNSTTSVNNATDIYGAGINQGIGGDWTKLYWGQSLATNSMNLLVNNSVSKGLLHANPHTSTYDNDSSKLKYYVPGYQRAGALHDNTDAGIANGTKPDIIYLYMGTEDRKQSNPTGFAAKYRETLNAITAAYPEAEVFCFTTMAYFDGGGYRGIGYTSGSSSARMTSVNNSIRTIACEYENVTLVDIADIITMSNYKTYFPETVTRVAPNNLAHDEIAARLQKALESQFKK